jgi:arginine/serine-rich splicing factor 4/5/6
MADEDDRPARGEKTSDVIGSAALRSVFLGNLQPNYTSEDVINIFEKPVIPSNAEEGFFDPIPVQRVDVKRSYCFVFLKDATTQEVKGKCEKFVSDINGM